MRSSTAWMLAGGLALTAACKKKPSEAPTGGDQAGSAVAAGSATTPTAAGGAVADLPVVTDCPKSLAGTEKVARTIKRECGPITVTDTLTIDGSLTLEAGVVLKFAAGAELAVGYSGPAKLIVKGGDAPDQRVVFTSAGDQAAGVWKGVALYDGADRSQITGLDLEYAGADQGAALMLRGATEITFTKSSIKHAKDVGLTARDKSAFAQFTGNQFEDIGKIAVSVESSTVGTLGPGNTFAKDAFIEIRGGQLERDATWNNIGAPYHITDDVTVDTASTPAKLTIGDATLRFAPDAELSIGYASRGKLNITGPAVLTSIEGTPGTWDGVRVYDQGEATIDKATLSSGGGADGGVLHVKSGAKVTLGEVAFNDNKIGLWVDDKATFAAAKPLTFSGNERAAHLSPTALGALTGANVFAEGQIIELSGGAIHASTTWSLQPKATVQILDDIAVDDSTTLTVAAGGTYQWKGGAGLTVGYASTGTLKVQGRADAPVTFAAIPGGEPWKGVQLAGEARSVELAYLNLADVEGDAGVTAKASATGKLDHVSCARCAATVAPECKAKLETAAISGGAGTKIGVKKPEDC